MFARTTPPLLDELRAAVERGDGRRARRLAHKLRSSTETVGATRLSALALALEHDRDADIGELERAYREDLDELRRRSPREQQLT